MIWHSKRLPLAPSIKWTGKISMRRSSWPTDPMAMQRVQVSCGQRRARRIYSSTIRRFIIALRTRM